MLIREIKKRLVPFNLVSQYTMNGRVGVMYWYKNNSYPSDRPKIYKKEQIDSFIERIKRKKVFYYGKTDFWLYQALERFSIKGKKVAILGSTSPLYESMCIFYGGEPTTIEYNRLISEDPRLRTITLLEYNNNPIQFDAAFSISSFEHDGLGRYGDPLNPDGDLLAMQSMKSILRPDSILFLAVPIGIDRLVWNIHRIYGRFRLPLLLKDWEVLYTFGFKDDLLNKANYRGRIQPIFVLKNNGNR